MLRNNLDYIKEQLAKEENFFRKEIEQTKLEQNLKENRKKNKSFWTKKSSNKTMEIVEAINPRDNVKEFIEEKF